jgi:predicted Kef-type K+ transport protein
MSAATSYGMFSISLLMACVSQKILVPAVAGFLVAATLVGLQGLNLISDLHQVETLAEIGVGTGNCTK